MYPRNSLGYSDIEHPASHFINKIVIFTVGDSFLEGRGLRDFRDRMPDILRSRLGKNYTVVNISKGGWSTNNEYKAIVTYPYKPDMIIVSYYINDIDVAANYYRGPANWYPKKNLIQTVAGKSYFIDFIYWRLFRLVSIKNLYWDQIYSAFTDRNIFNIHMNELDYIIKHTRENDIKLIVLIFPHLSAIEETKMFTSKVAAFLRSKDVEVIDLAERLAGRDPSALVVNPLDTHPSKQLNKEIAEMLLNHIREHFQSEDIMP